MTIPRTETDLIGLAERCEKATGPDLALNDAIAKFKHELDGRMWSGLSKPYTASLDAAMTLVPEGYEATIDISMARSTVHLFGGDPLASATAATPALALCAAALRAIASHKEKSRVGS